jgi:hypothetical protein
MLHRLVCVADHSSVLRPAAQPLAIYTQSEVHDTLYVYVAVDLIVKRRLAPYSQVPMGGHCWSGPPVKRLATCVFTALGDARTHPTMTPPYPTL